MKIAFITEYFPPFTPGGAEWSTYYLAKDLARNKDMEISVITPNYGAKSYEEKEGIKIYRLPFYKKLKKNSPALTSFYYVNPIWLFWVAFQIFKFVKKNNIDIIHVHGKFFIPTSLLANIFLKRKILATIRDYQVICNYGFCLYSKDKSCNLWEYFTSDFSYYWKHYVVVKTPFNFLSNLAFAIYGRLTRNFLKMFSTKIPVIVLSGRQKAIFLKNSFAKIEVIGNSVDFPSRISRRTRENLVIFAGRLTPGKGVGILTGTIPDFFAKFTNVTFAFAGEGFLKDNLKELAKKYRNLKILGQIEHKKLLDLFAKSKVVVVPSIWPEPFGRVAIESLSQGTPVIVTSKGGLPEIVKDGRWGFVVAPTKGDLLLGIKKAIKINETLQKNIQKDFGIIKKRFGRDITNRYIEIYKELFR